MKRIMQVIVIAILLTGVTGCMSNQEEKTKQAMLEYLENKYGETFVPERYEKGPGPLSEMSDEDRMLVHPTINGAVPFYVFEDEENSSFTDNYIILDFSNKYTQKYGIEISQIDHREKAIKFALLFSDRPNDPKLLQLPVDEYVETYGRNGEIDLYIAILQNDPLDITKESHFIYNLYQYMRGKTDEDFYISVAYLNSEQFNSEETRNLIRVANTINFSWRPLGKDFRSIGFFSRDATNDISFFMQLLQERWGGNGLGHKY